MKDLLRTQLHVAKKIEKNTGMKHSAAIFSVKRSLVAAYSASNIAMPKELRAPMLDGGNKKHASESTDDSESDEDTAYSASNSESDEEFSPTADRKVIEQPCELRISIEDAQRSVSVVGEVDESPEVVQVVEEAVASVTENPEDIDFTIWDQQTVEDDSLSVGASSGCETI